VFVERRMVDPEAVDIASSRLETDASRRPLGGTLSGVVNIASVHGPSKLCEAAHTACTCRRRERAG
jgi:hypothetical protein